MAVDGEGVGGDGGMDCVGGDGQRGRGVCGNGTGTVLYMAVWADRLIWNICSYSM